MNLRGAKGKNEVKEKCEYNEAGLRAKRVLGLKKSKSNSDFFCVVFSHFKQLYSAFSYDGTVLAIAVNRTKKISVNLNH